MPLGQDQFRPQGLDWQDFCRGPLNVVHTKYLSCGPHSFRETDSFTFFYPLLSPWELMVSEKMISESSLATLFYINMTPGVWPVWTPRA